MGPRSRTKILLVLSRDDDLVGQVREAAQVILDRPEPVVVHSGAACLSALEAQPTALLILDDAVQRGSGPVLLYRIRTAHPQLRIVYVASHHNAELEREVRQIGVLYYTAKPLGQRELASLIASFMGLRVTGSVRDSGNDPS